MTRQGKGRNNESKGIDRNNPVAGHGEVQWHHAIFQFFLPEWELKKVCSAVQVF